MADEEQSDAEQKQVNANGFGGEHQKNSDEGGYPLSPLEFEVKRVHMPYPGSYSCAQYPEEGETEGSGDEDGGSTFSDITDGGYCPTPDAHLTEDSAGADVAGIDLADVSPSGEPGDDIGKGDGAQ